MKTLPHNDEHDVLAMEYALGVLEGAERAQFEARVKNDLPLAARLRHWEEHFAGFADEIAPVQPPKRIQSAIEKNLFAETAVTKPSLWNSLRFWRGLAVASFAGVIAIGTWNLRPDPSPSPQLVAQVAGAQDQLRLVALYDQDKGELRLNRVTGSAATGRSLELWLIAGQDAPVSLGVLPETSANSVRVPEALREKFKDGVLAISDEPQGGSTTGAPTGAVLATGQLTAI